VWQRFYAEFETMERLQSPVEEMRSWELEREDIEKALAGLPPEQLQVLQLSIVEGLPQTEIATKLSLPLGTVKSRMRLAFEKLRGAREREI
jgi:RNA polymerase sigma-70 factor (ECF subfamily)